MDPKQKLFRRYKAGTSSALASLLDEERPLLYDYLLRMTGQVSRAMDTVEEVFLSLVDGSLEDIGTFEELRICIYSTARKFNADVWNAETTKLINPALETYESPDTKLSEGEDEADWQRELHLVDRSLRSLPGPEREAVILKSRGGFTDADAAQIIGVKEAECANLYDKGMQKIDAESPGLSDGPETCLARLPLHAMPYTSSQATVNLSLMMQDIKVKPQGVASYLPVLLLVLIVLLLGAWIFFPDHFDFYLFARIRGLFSGH